MRIYLLLGHPDRHSFNGALADAFERSALAKGHELRRHNLGELRFDPVLRRGNGTAQPLEPDLLEAQAHIAWCERWVILYPVWWGAAPALLKGYFDRVLEPGFAYRPHETGPFWDKLLERRSARVITTSDAPPLWLWWRYRDSDLGSVRRATLEFCGIGPVRVTRIGRVRFLDEEQRRRWIERVAALA